MMVLYLLSVFLVCLATARNTRTSIQFAFPHPEHDSPVIDRDSTSYYWHYVCRSNSNQAIRNQVEGTTPDFNSVHLDLNPPEFPANTSACASILRVHDASEPMIAALCIAVANDPEISNQHFRSTRNCNVRQQVELAAVESACSQGLSSKIVGVCYNDACGGHDDSTARRCTISGRSTTEFSPVLYPEMFHQPFQASDDSCRISVRVHDDEAREAIGATVPFDPTHSRAVSYQNDSVSSLRSILTHPVTVLTNQNKTCVTSLAGVADVDGNLPNCHADNFSFIAVRKATTQQFAVVSVDGLSLPSTTLGTSALPVVNADKYTLRGDVSRILARKIPRATPSGTSQDMPNTDPPPYIPPAEGWPQNWQFVNFPQNQPAVLHAAYIGLIDAWRLAENCVESLTEGTLSASYHRYFQPADSVNVEHIYNAVLREGAVPSTGTPHNSRTWKIYYDDASFRDPQCWKNNVYAYFIETPQFAMPTIILCPVQFEQYQRNLDQIDCKNIGSQATENAMDNIGATLLHEMLHDYSMTGDAAGLFTSDVEFEVLLRKADGGTHEKIVTGYGPYWSSYVNAQQHQGTSNVDNFVWYALEAWFSRKCGVQFDDPAVAPTEGIMHPA